MPRRMPILPRNTIRLDDPAETNGSGRPVGGIEPVTTAILTIT